jgi:hypothetical protein
LDTEPWIQSFALALPLEPQPQSLQKFFNGLRMGNALAKYFVFSVHIGSSVKIVILSALCVYYEGKEMNNYETFYHFLHPWKPGFLVWKKRAREGWECTSVIEFLPSMHKTLVPNITTKKKYYFSLSLSPSSLPFSLTPFPSSLPLSY